MGPRNLSQTEFWQKFISPLFTVWLMNPTAILHRARQAAVFCVKCQKDSPTKIYVKGRRVFARFHVILYCNWSTLPCRCSLRCLCAFFSSPSLLRSRFAMSSWPCMMLVRVPDWFLDLWNQAMTAFPDDKHVGKDVLPAMVFETQLQLKSRNIYQLITYISVTRLLWNLSQSMIVILPESGNISNELTTEEDVTCKQNRIAKFASFSRRHFKWIFLNENVWISINISLKFFLWVQLTIFQYWFR